ncbi:hypothetical protein ACFL42_03810, partial [Candidatus Omnitrophota bacterium]
MNQIVVDTASLFAADGSGFSRAMLNKIMKGISLEQEDLWFRFSVPGADGEESSSSWSKNGEIYNKDNEIVTTDFDGYESRRVGSQEFADAQAMIAYMRSNLDNPEQVMMDDLYSLGMMDDTALGYVRDFGMRDTYEGDPYTVDFNTAMNEYTADLKRNIQRVKMDGRTYTYDFNPGVNAVYDDLGFEVMEIKYSRSPDRPNQAIGEVEKSDELSVSLADELAEKLGISLGEKATEEGTWTADGFTPTHVDGFYSEHDFGAGMKTCYYDRNTESVYIIETGERIIGAKDADKQIGDGAGYVNDKFSKLDEVIDFLKGFDAGALGYDPATNLTYWAIDKLPALPKAEEEAPAGEEAADADAEAPADDAAAEEDDAAAPAEEAAAPAADAEPVDMGALRGELTALVNNIMEANGLDPSSEAAVENYQALAAAIEEFLAKTEGKSVEELKGIMQQMGEELKDAIRADLDGEDGTLSPETAIKSFIYQHARASITVVPHTRRIFGGRQGEVAMEAGADGGGAVVPIMDAGITVNMTSGGPAVDATVTIGEGADVTVSFEESDANGNPVVKISVENATLNVDGVESRVSFEGTMSVSAAAADGEGEGTLEGRVSSLSISLKDGLSVDLSGVRIKVSLGDTPKVMIDSGGEMILSMGEGDAAATFSFNENFDTATERVLADIGRFADNIAQGLDSSTELPAGVDLNDADGDPLIDGDKAEEKAGETNILGQLMSAKMDALVGLVKQRLTKSRKERRGLGIQQLRLAKLKDAGNDISTLQDAKNVLTELLDVLMEETVNASPELRAEIGALLGKVESALKIEHAKLREAAMGGAAAAEGEGEAAEGEEAEGVPGADAGVPTAPATPEARSVEPAPEVPRPEAGAGAPAAAAPGLPDGPGGAPAEGAAAEGAAGAAAEPAEGPAAPVGEPAEDAEAEEGAGEVTTIMVLKGKDADADSIKIVKVADTGRFELRKGSRKIADVTFKKQGVEGGSITIFFVSLDSVDVELMADLKIDLTGVDAEAEGDVAVAAQLETGEEGAVETEALEMMDLGEGFTAFRSGETLYVPVGDAVSTIGAEAVSAETLDGKTAEVKVFSVKRNMLQGASIEALNSLFGEAATIEVTAEVSIDGDPVEVEDVEILVNVENESVYIVTGERTVTISFDELRSNQEVNGTGEVLSKTLTLLNGETEDIKQYSITGNTIKEKLLEVGIDIKGTSLENRLEAILGDDGAAPVAVVRAWQGGEVTFEEKLEKIDLGDGVTIYRETDDRNNVHVYMFNVDSFVEVECREETREDCEAPSSAPVGAKAEIADIVLKDALDNTIEVPDSVIVKISGAFGDAKELSSPVMLLITEEKADGTTTVIDKIALAEAKAADGSTAAVAFSKDGDVFVLSDGKFKQADIGSVTKELGGVKGRGPGATLKINSAKLKDDLAGASSLNAAESELVVQLFEQAGVSVADAELTIVDAKTGDTKTVKLEAVEVEGAIVYRAMDGENAIYVMPGAVFTEATMKASTALQLTPEGGKLTLFFTKERAAAGVSPFALAQTAAKIEDILVAGVVKAKQEKLKAQKEASSIKSAQTAIDNINAGLADAGVTVDIDIDTMKAAHAGNKDAIDTVKAKIKLARAEASAIKTVKKLTAEFAAKGATIKLDVATVKAAKLGDKAAMAEVKGKLKDARKEVAKGIAKERAQGKATELNRSLLGAGLAATATPEMFMASSSKDVRAQGDALMKQLANKQEANALNAAAAEHAIAGSVTAEEVKLAKMDLDTPECKAAKEKVGGLQKAVSKAKAKVERQKQAAEAFGKFEQRANEAGLDAAAGDFTVTFTLKDSKGNIVMEGDKPKTMTVAVNATTVFMSRQGDATAKQAMTAFFGKVNAAESFPGFERRAEAAGVDNLEVEIPQLDAKGKVVMDVGTGKPVMEKVTVSSDTLMKSKQGDAKAKSAMKALAKKFMAAESKQRLTPGAEKRFAKVEAQAAAAGLDNLTVTVNENPVTVDKDTFVTAATGTPEQKAEARAALSALDDKIADGKAQTALNSLADRAINSGMVAAGDVTRVDGDVTLITFTDTSGKKAEVTLDTLKGSRGSPPLTKAIGRLRTGKPLTDEQKATVISALNSTSDTLKTEAVEGLKAALADPETKAQAIEVLTGAVDIGGSWNLENFANIAISLGSTEMMDKIVEKATGYLTTTEDEFGGIAGVEFTQADGAQAILVLAAAGHEGALGQLSEVAETIGRFSTDAGASTKEMQMIVLFELTETIAGSTDKPEIAAGCAAVQDAVVTWAGAVMAVTKRTDAALNDFAAFALASGNEKLQEFAQEYEALATPVAEAAAAGAEAIAVETPSDRKAMAGLQGALNRAEVLTGRDAGTRGAKDEGTKGLMKRAEAADLVGAGANEVEVPAIGDDGQPIQGADPVKVTVDGKTMVMSTRSKEAKAMLASGKNENGEKLTEAEIETLKGCVTARAAVTAYMNKIEGAESKKKFAEVAPAKLAKVEAQAAAAGVDMEVMVDGVGIVEITEQTFINAAAGSPEEKAEARAALSALDDKIADGKAQTALNSLADRAINSGMVAAGDVTRVDGDVTLITFTDTSGKKAEVTLDTLKGSRGSPPLTKAIGRLRTGKPLTDEQKATVISALNSTSDTLKTEAVEGLKAALADPETKAQAIEVLTGAVDIGGSWNLENFANIAISLGSTEMMDKIVEKATGYLTTTEDEFGGIAGVEFTQADGAQAILVLAAAGHEGALGQLSEVAETIGRFSTDAGASTKEMQMIVLFELTETIAGSTDKPEIAAGCAAVQDAVVTWAGAVMAVTKRTDAALNDFAAFALASGNEKLQEFAQEYEALATPVAEAAAAGAEAIAVETPSDRKAMAGLQGALNRAEVLTGRDAGTRGAKDEGTKGLMKRAEAADLVGAGANEVEVPAIGDDGQPIQGADPVKVTVDGKTMVMSTRSKEAKAMLASGKGPDGADLTADQKETLKERVAAGEAVKAYIGKIQAAEAFALIAKRADEAGLADLEVSILKMDENGMMPDEPLMESVTVTSDTLMMSKKGDARAKQAMKDLMSKIAAAESGKRLTAGATEAAPAKFAKVEAQADAAGVDLTVTVNGEAMTVTEQTFIDAAAGTGAVKEKARAALTALGDKIADGKAQTSFNALADRAEASGMHVTRRDGDATSISFTNAEGDLVTVTPDMLQQSRTGTPKLDRVAAKLEAGEALTPDDEAVMGAALNNVNGNISSAAGAALGAALDSENPEVRAQAIGILIDNVQANEARSVLTDKITSSPDSKEIVGAILAEINFEDPDNERLDSMTSVLADAVESEATDNETRQEAIVGLSDVVDKLVEGMSDSPSPLHSLAIERVASVNNSEVRSMIKQKLPDIGSALTNGMRNTEGIERSGFADAFAALASVEEFRTSEQFTASPAIGFAGGMQDALDEAAHIGIENLNSENTRGSFRGARMVLAAAACGSEEAIGKLDSAVSAVQAFCAEEAEEPNFETDYMMAGLVRFTDGVSGPGSSEKVNSCVALMQDAALTWANETFESSGIDQVGFTVLTAADSKNDRLQAFGEANKAAADALFAPTGEAAPAAVGYASPDTSEDRKEMAAFQGAIAAAESWSGKPERDGKPAITGLSQRAAAAGVDTKVTISTKIGTETVTEEIEVTIDTMIAARGGNEKAGKAVQALREKIGGKKRADALNKELASAGLPESATPEMFMSTSSPDVRAKADSLKTDVVNEKKAKAINAEAGALGIATTVTKEDIGLAKVPTAEGRAAKAKVDGLQKAVDQKKAEVTAAAELDTAKATAAEFRKELDGVGLTDVKINIDMLKPSAKGRVQYQSKLKHMIQGQKKANALNESLKSFGMQEEATFEMFMPSSFSTRPLISKGRELGNKARMAKHQGTMDRVASAECSGSDFGTTKCVGEEAALVAMAGAGEVSGERKEEMARSGNSNTMSCSNCVNVAVLTLVKAGRADLARDFVKQGIAMLTELNKDENFAKNGGEQMLQLFKEAGALLAAFEKQIEGGASKEEAIGALEAGVDAAAVKMGECETSLKPLQGDVLNAVVEALNDASMIQDPKSSATFRMATAKEIVTSWTKFDGFKPSDTEMNSIDTLLTEPSGASSVREFAEQQFTKAMDEGAATIDGVEMLDSMIGALENLGAAASGLSELVKSAKAEVNALFILSNPEAATETDIGNAANVLLSAGTELAFDVLNKAMDSRVPAAKEAISNAVVANPA